MRSGDSKGALKATQGHDLSFQVWLWLVGRTDEVQKGKHAETVCGEQEGGSAGQGVGLGMPHTGN